MFNNNSRSLEVLRKPSTPEHLLSVNSFNHGRVYCLILNLEQETKV